MSATDKQVGGDHYQTAIQPIQYILANGLGFCEGNVIKYVTRYKTKGTPLQDLEKAKHYIEFLIEQEQQLAALMAEEDSAFIEAQTPRPLSICVHGYQHCTAPGCHSGALS